VYIALYVTAPIRQIDRFVKINEKLTEVRSDGKYCFGFEWKTQLGYPITIDEQLKGIRRRRYVTLQTFLGARTLDDLLIN
jgi:hypothetical protein